MSAFRVKSLAPTAAYVIPTSPPVSPSPKTPLTPDRDVVDNKNARYEIHDEKDYFENIIHGIGSLKINHEKDGLVQLETAPRKDLSSMESRHSAITGICRTLLKAGEKTAVSFDMKNGDNSDPVKILAGDFLEEIVCVSTGNFTMTHPQNLARLKDRIDNYVMKVLNLPRKGKKLLVLDLDYTLFDHLSVGSVAEVARPYLHEFLTAVYKYYDIYIWSATSMDAILLKLTRLGVYKHSDYKIVMMLDNEAMIPVTTGFGTMNTKPLGLLWGRFPGYYNRSNSVMIDDIRYNFLMNGSNGLRIRPCQNMPELRGQDTELQWLTKYLLEIACLDEAAFRRLNHRCWERVVSRYGVSTPAALVDIIADDARATATPLPTGAVPVATQRSLKFEK